MKIKNLNKLFLVYIIILLVFSLPPMMQYASATTYTHIEHFDGGYPLYAKNLTNNTFAFTIYNNAVKGDAWSISSTKANTAPYSYQILNNQTHQYLWFNVTNIPGGNYIDNFTFNMYVGDPGATYGIGTLFFDFYNSTNYLLYNLSLFGSSGEWMSGNGFSSDVGITPNSWANCYIKYVSPYVGGFGYGTSTAKQRTMTITADWKGFSKLRIYSYAAESDFNHGKWFDDVGITVKQYPGGISGCIDTTGLVQTGQFGGGSYEVFSQHISTKFNVQTITNVKAIELQIMADQYTSDPDLQNYWCVVNGYNLSHPICFEQESYYYYLQWSCNFNLTNEVMNFDFCHNKSMGYDQPRHRYLYWDVGIGISTTDDLQNDGYVGFYWTDSSIVYHWVWHYWVPVYEPLYGPGMTFVPYDLSYRFWDTGYTTSDSYNYTNTIGLSHYTAKNATGYIYNLTLGYFSMVGDYTLGSKLTSYTVKMFYGAGAGSEQTTYGFPRKAKYPGGTFGVSPSVTGKYRFQLYSTHAVANVTAWVTGILPKYYIVTNPVISNQFETYYINYSYNHPQGYHGGIAMDYYLGELSTYSKTPVQYGAITNNATGSFTYVSSSTGLPEYWGLYSYMYSLYNLIISTEHYIQNPSIFTNAIHTYRQNYETSYEQIANITIGIFGTHTFPGGDVQLYCNGIYFAQVGEQQSFTADVRPLKFGAFQVTMYLYVNGTLQFLAYTNFTISATDQPQEQPSGYDSIIGFIPTWAYIFVAIGIIIGFAFMPFSILYMILSKLKTGTGIEINIPSIVMLILSVITSMIGYTLTILWGLMPWWSVFMLLFVLIMVFAIFYYSRKNEGQQ